MSTGNSIIPTAVQHDRHYAHCCTVCDAEFSRRHPPAGEVLFNGTWADACAKCHELLKEEEEEEEEIQAHAASPWLLTSLTSLP